MDTGITVLREDGVLNACTKRQKMCGYACCKFTAGNWIMLLPGEYEKAMELGLKTDHLTFDATHTQVTCTKPCVGGELKPMDCSWYPLFPANDTATKFIVADHRKCPIPNYELIDKMLSVHRLAVAWEKRHPGSLKHVAELSRGFVGYLPFPYKLEYGEVLEMSDEEMADIAQPQQLPENYVCKEWTISADGYTATETPEDVVFC